MRRKKKVRFKPRFFVIIICFMALIAGGIIGVKKMAEAKAEQALQAQQEAEAQQQETLQEEPKAVRPESTTPDSAYPLSVPDADILVLVNKTHTVTESYEPADLVKVEHCDESVGNSKTRMMRKAAADMVEELIAGAKEAGFDIVMRTGYRDYNYQKGLFDSYAANHGIEEANKFSAKPGESEHQTGLCCDLGRLGYGLTSFDGTEEAKWVAENSWKYGFILRYPADKTDITGYIYESWHIRYVGKEAAKLIYEEGLTLEEFLGRTD